MNPHEVYRGFMELLFDTHTYKALLDITVSVLCSAEVEIKRKTIFFKKLVIGFVYVLNCSR